MEYIAKKIAIGCDHAGVELKSLIAELLTSNGCEVIMFGADGSGSVDYPDVAGEVCRAVLSKNAELAILICGTGIGMSMAANRNAGIRAALCSDCVSAGLTRSHNNANVLCIGARILGPELVLGIVDKFLSTKFDGGRHSRRIEKIEACRCGGV